MDSEASSVLLTKEQLAKILNEMSAGYITPTEAAAPTLPSYKKLGVLLDLDEIAQVKELPAKPCNINNNSYINIKTTTQSYSCAECKRTLPTAHLLDLHITEQHDFYFAASVERGDKPMYACYLEECALKLHSPKERKDHCISVHKFPANYRFGQKPKKSKAKGSSLDKQEASMEVDVLPPNPPHVPYIKAFSFGHHTQRTFNTHKESREPGKPLANIQALKDALDEIME